MATAENCAALRGSCRKPRGALYIDYGGEWLFLPPVPGRLPSSSLVRMVAESCRPVEL
ncbi:Uncharacterised protein [Amycolatopsis camponoti]|uniref:Uncharacterized protein n=1 Tax=Amycolatopsis camponoti TaxID=2606593 RepID=A0A6I8LTB6_9PSEU|nr:Uncharacterised protein [Amycolatopsis camponoti]